MRTPKRSGCDLWFRCFTRNDQYCYSLQAGKSGRELNGLGEIESIVQKNWPPVTGNMSWPTQKELEETKKQLSEAEEYADGLFQRLETERPTSSNSEISISLNLLRLRWKNSQKNPQLLHKLPGGETLAGIIEQDTIEKQQSLSRPQEETQASFQKKTAPGSELKPEHLQYIPVLQQLEQAFNAEQLELLSKILNSFRKPANLTPVAELLNIQIS